MSRLLVLVLAVLALAAPAVAAPLEAYGKLPSIEATALSPSGAQVALVVTNGEQRVVVVQELASKKIRLRAGAGEVAIRGLRWAGEEHLVLVSRVTGSPLDVMTTKRDWMLAYALEVATGKVTPFLRDVGQAMNVVLDYPVTRATNGELIAFAEGISFGEDGKGRRSLYRVNVRTGVSRLVEPGTTDTRDWVIGSSGEAIGEEAYDGRSGRWTLRIKGPGGWRNIENATALRDRPFVMGPGRNGDSVVYAAPDGPTWTMREVRADGQPTTDIPILLSNPEPITDPHDGRLLGQWGLVGDEYRIAFFDPEDKRMWDAVVKAFPGSHVTPRSWSVDRRKVLVRVDSPVDGPAYAIVDLTTRDAKWLGDEYLGVKAADVAPKTAIAFKARDGLDLTGYLTLPRGREPKGLPLLVVPHDGPAQRNTPAFDWFSQAAASRGYAVLQVNYRGSYGLGAGLMEAGYGEWGRKMQSDLSDGVRKLAADGTIDPARVCIAGDGYGGYAALAGVTLESGVYRCAVALAGISDLRRQLAHARKRGGVEHQRYWERYIGTEDPASLDQRSPLTLAAQASAPVLLIHGKDDVVVPLEQSQLMAKALEKAGKPVQLVVQKGGDHELSLGQTRFEVLAATMAFVERHNPPN